MEITIKINHEEYTELTGSQKRGLAELIQLESVREMTGKVVEVTPEEVEKPKRTRKSKKADVSEPTTATETPATTHNEEVNALPTNDTTDVKEEIEEKISELVPSDGTVDAEQPEQSIAPTEPVADEQPTEVVAPQNTETVAVPTIEEIMAAGSKFITQNPGKIAELQGVFAKYGIKQITGLKATPDKIPAFVEDIKAVGVVF